MQKMLKTMLNIFIAVLVLLFIAMFVQNEDGEYLWNPFDYAKITDVEYKAVVVDQPGSNGKIVITERLTFDVHAFSHGNRFWELWRDLCEDTIDGVKVEYNVLSVKQIFSDGREPLVYTEAPKLYWNDSDYISTGAGLGPGKWYHSKGPYNEGFRRYECVFFYVNGLYRDKVVFEIEYEMYNAALRWADSSELYISLFSEKDVNHLNSFKAQILFPEDKMPREGNYYANTYGTNAHSFPFTESATENPGYYTFSFELDRSHLKFRPYNEYIEFALVSFGEDKHIFTQYASKNDYYNEDALEELRQEQSEYDRLPGRGAMTKTIILSALAVIALLVLLVARRTAEKFIEMYVRYEPAEQIDYFKGIPRQLDPTFAAELVFCKQKPLEQATHGYAAIMLSLARKGYIEISDSSTRNASIVLLRGTTPEPIDSEEQHEQYEAGKERLTPTEKLYYGLIVRHARDGKIKMNTFQHKVSKDYENTSSFVKNVKNAVTKIGVTQGYFQKAEYKEPKKALQKKALKYGIIGAAIMLFANLISNQTRVGLAFGAYFVLGLGFIAAAIYLVRQSGKCVLLTQFGEDEYAKWRGLYNFLNSEKLMLEKTALDMVLWEQYLVYAAAFGISSKVIDALKIRCDERDLKTSPVLQNRYVRSRGFYVRSRSFRHATRTASFRGYSSGFGGYSGGYGGGGRGGGGGGGGH